MNREEFARTTGVTGPAVRQWIKEGLPAVRTGTAGNAGYAIDPPTALHWLIEKRVNKAVMAERRRMERKYNLIPDVSLDEISLSLE